MNYPKLEPSDSRLTQFKTDFEKGVFVFDYPDCWDKGELVEGDQGLTWEKCVEFLNSLNRDLIIYGRTLPEEYIRLTKALREGGEFFAVNMSRGKIIDLLIKDRGNMPYHICNVDEKDVVFDGKEDAPDSAKPSLFKTSGSRKYRLRRKYRLLREKEFLALAGSFNPETVQKWVKNKTHLLLTGEERYKNSWSADYGYLGEDGAPRVTNDNYDIEFENAENILRVLSVKTFLK